MVHELLLQNCFLTQFIYCIWQILLNWKFRFYAFVLKCNGKETVTGDFWPLNICTICCVYPCPKTQYGFNFAYVSALTLGDYLLSKDTEVFALKFWCFALSFKETVSNEFWTPIFCVSIPPVHVRTAGP